MFRLALLAAFAIAAPARAGLVSRDLFEPGDGLLTYDDVNHREWLNLEYSSQFGSPDNPWQVALPPALSDFTHATLGDVEALMDSASVPWMGDNGPQLTDGTEHHLYELLGETGEYNSSIIGRIIFTGGYVAIDPDTRSDLDQTVAVVALNYGAGAVPRSYRDESRQKRHIGYNRLDLDGYLYVLGRIDLPLDTDGDIDALGSPSPSLIDGGSGITSYWLYRDAAPIPEPAAAYLAVTASLGAWRLRVRRSPD